MSPDERPIKGEPRMPIKFGTVTTIDMETGEVISVNPNAMTMLPCKDGVCPECGVDHPVTEPHNRQSLVYQYRFHATHGRWPTWMDATSHCSDKVIEQYKSHGLPIPEDLISDPKGTQ